MVAALVVAAHLLAERPLQQLLVHRLAGRRMHGHVLERVEQPARVAVGVADDAFARFRRQLRRAGQRLGAIQQQRLVGRLHRAQHVHGRAREQRGIDLERRILGGGADEGEQAGLDVRQEGVLLRLVEAVHLVDEDDRAAPARARLLRVHDGLADVLDAGQHRRQHDEFGVHRAGHQARQRRLADARRPPQDHRVQPARTERDAQRMAFAQQVLLADDLVQRARAQALGERDGIGRRLDLGRRGRAAARRGGVVSEEVVLRRHGVHCVSPDGTGCSSTELAGPRRSFRAFAVPAGLHTA